MDTSEHVDPQSLAQSLLSSSHWHARNAFNLWEAPEYNQRLSASISAGTSVELLLKHLLATKSPLFLAPLKAERNPGIASRVAFNHEDFGTHLAQVQSCSAEEAFTMVESTIVGRAPLARDEFTEALVVRNAAAHLAVLVPKEELRDTIYSVITMFGRATLNEEFWANSFRQDPGVAAFIDDYQQDRARFAKKKIEDAKRAFNVNPARGVDSGHNRMEQIQHAFLDREAYLIFGIQPESWVYFFPDVQETKCVACKQRGLMLCGSEGAYVDAEGNETDDQAEENLGLILTPVAFACPTCGLQLTGREMDALKEEGHGWATTASKSFGQRTEENLELGAAYTLSIIRDYY